MIGPNQRYLGFEGGEGAGKTRVSREVRELLSSSTGIEIVPVREPGGTETGEMIRKILLPREEWKFPLTPRAEALLFAAGRAQLVAEVIDPALYRGAAVVSDRTFFSSVAYQGAARGLGMAQVLKINEFALQGTIPGCVILLDIDPKLGLGREGEQDRISKSDLRFHQNVNRAYREMAKIFDKMFVVVDASMPLDEVVAECMSIISKRWEI